MKKLILLLFIPLVSFGQGIKVEVNSGGLFINSNKISNQTDASFIEAILGKPNKKFLNETTLWVYDELGIQAWIDPETEKFTQFDVWFSGDETNNFTPNNAFIGEVVVYNNYISENSPWNSIKKVSEFKVLEEIGLIFNVITDNYLNYTFSYSEETGNLREVSFWKVGNAYEYNIKSSGEPDLETEILPKNETTNAKQSYLAFVKQTVNFRRGPGSDFDIIKSLPAGTQLFVISTDDVKNYYNVIDLETNTEGYVYKTFVELDKVIDVKEDDLFVKSGKSSSLTVSEIEIYNNTNKVLTVYIGGISHSFIAQERRNINISPGQYDYRVTAPGVLPYLGKDEIEAGANYTWEFYIITK
tara:strand:- start:122 stop:1192 length:1071 start_codon:yes stop_codon:yes gene_type:complete